MKYESIKSEAIPTGGATISIDVDEPRTLYVFTGSGTLTGNITIAATGTPVFGHRADILWLCNFTLGANTISIFGKTLTTVQATKPIEITALYDSTSWRVFLDGLFGATGTVETGDIADDAITLAKLADITRGSIIVGGTSNAPTALDANNSGQILIGDGTDLLSLAVTGDITITGGGVVAIAAGVIVNADISASAAIVLTKLASGASAQIIVANGSGVPVYVDMTGDVTISNAGVAAIAAGVIVNADINASAGIVLSKLAGAAAGSIIVANGSSVFAAATMSGDATISSTGVITIGAGAITLSKLGTTGFYDRDYNAGGVATTGTVEETLATSTYTGGDVGTNDRSLVIEVTGFTAANANNKRIKVKWEGNTMADTGALAANGSTFFIRVVVTRQSSSSIYYKFVCNVGGTTVTGRGTVAGIDWTSNQSITVTGETPTASGDATFLETYMTIIK